MSHHCDKCRALVPVSGVVRVHAPVIGIPPLVLCECCCQGLRWEISRIIDRPWIRRGRVKGKTDAAQV